MDKKLLAVLAMLIIGMSVVMASFFSFIMPLNVFLSPNSADIKNSFPMLVFLVSSFIVLIALAASR